MTDQDVIDAVRRDGATVLPGFLNVDELALARDELEHACHRLGKSQDGQLPPRTRLDTLKLLDYPTIGGIYGNARIMALCRALIGEDDIWLEEIVCNRYEAGHPGVVPHIDESRHGVLSEPYMRITWALFLDDISDASGALMIAPGTHIDNFADPNVPDKRMKTEADIVAADYVPLELKAGSLVIRSADVFHCVRPIHHLRRYVTGTWTSRIRMTSWLHENYMCAVSHRNAVAKGPEALWPCLV